MKLNLKHGAEAAAKAYIQEKFDENFLVISKAEAIELGLFGLPNQALSMDCYDRIGDLIMISRNDWVCYQSLTGEAKTFSTGTHGGLSRDEMLIPFLAYRF